MLKRKLSLLSTAAVISLGASLALPLSSAQAEDVTLKLVMASYTDDMLPYYTDLITRFEAANAGIKVDLDVVAWPEIGQKVKTLIASGQSPDIVNNDEFSGEAADGLLYPASKIVSAATLQDIIPALFFFHSLFECGIQLLPMNIVLHIDKIDNDNSAYVS